ncbi:MAG: hypothetical protein B7W95_00510, partial [Acidimicrobiales bacterium 20-64-4]
MRHVVVDGSNLATEGRSLPSLVQLDEAVRAYMVEDPNAEIIVVVDASFEHRVDESERARFKEAEVAGELITPPAGAVGRGDAFILKIAVLCAIAPVRTGWPKTNVKTLYIFYSTMLFEIRFCQSAFN